MLVRLGRFELEAYVSVRHLAFTCFARVPFLGSAFISRPVPSRGLWWDRDSSGGMIQLGRTEITYSPASADRRIAA